METPTEVRSKADSKELLLADYRYLADSFWKNELTGETRVNWFIGIVTASVGGLVSLARAEHSSSGRSMSLIVIACLCSLLVFGIATLLRLIKRNETTDGYKRSFDAIRQIFKDHFDSDHVLLQYYPFRERPKEDDPQESDQGARRADSGAKNSVGRQLGGLVQIVLAINSLLFAGLAGEFVDRALVGRCAAGYVWTWLAASAAFGLAFAGQFAYVNRRHALAEQELKRGRTSHAGGIVYRTQNGAVQYLLVGPREEKFDEWFFPKGHIESEGHGEAALREVREETGIFSRLICLLGSDKFNTPKEVVNVKYYLMEAIFQAKPSDSRRTKWFEFQEACELVSYDMNKHLLREAERKRIAISLEVSQPTASKP
jgi:8-oxo-dGTP pyrophosphatase MutT (NUDIX family)